MCLDGQPLESGKPVMTDDLTAATQLAEEARNCQQEMEDLEERVARIRARYNQIVTRDLAEIMTKRRLSSLSLEANGNIPGCDFELQMVCSASIKKDWDEERRERAFATLPPSLIKTEVAAVFPPGSHARAKDLELKLKDLGYDVEYSKSVHPSTLKKWLREAVANGVEVDLDALDAYVGTRVAMKKREE